jgi:hypothetical protein
MITPMRVFVLLFNARTDNEGIHTIREGDRNKILLFESEDDATRFALMLEAQDFPTPTVEAMNAEEVKQFCQSAGYDWEIVAKDTELILPPAINVDQPDWQADSKPNDTDDNTLRPSQDESEVQQLSDAELDSIRRKLEGLL